MSKGNPFLALRLSRHQHDALRAEAVESGLTLSELGRQILARHTAERVEPDPQQADAGAQSHRLVARRAKNPRGPSRPVRLQQATSEIEDLLADYEDWQTRLPESLQDTATGAALAETVDQLQQAADLLNAITAPRGFGRD